MHKSDNIQEDSHLQHQVKLLQRLMRTSCIPKTQECPMKMNVNEGNIRDEYGCAKRRGKGMALLQV
jgi:hypothetical protein